MNKRKPVEVKIFENSGFDFSALYAAQEWINGKGYSYGSSQRGAPTAIFKGDCYVSKWRNLSPKERNDVDGLLTYNDSRNGSVTVELYN